jgi:hypothetical protein
MLQVKLVKFILGTIFYHSLILGSIRYTTVKLNGFYGVRAHRLID